MYVRKEKKRDFLPARNHRCLEKSAIRNIEEVIPKRDDDEEVPDEMPTSFLDAETGETISFTKAKWTAKEGRLSLNAKMILDMGTGKLDIKARPSQLSSSSSSPSLKASLRPSRHDLVTAFLNSGPLTPYMHVNWNPRRDAVHNIQAADLGTLSDDEDDDGVLYGGVTEATVTNSATLSTCSAVIPSDSRSQPPSTISSSKIPLLLSLIISSIISFLIMVLFACALSGAIASYTEDQWSRLMNKTFRDLFGVAEQMEKNKSLTKEDPFPGGMKALQKTCWKLA